MKTFKSFLNEWSFTDRGIHQYMLSKGYQKLGSGVDQTAYEKPGENSIVKVFGTWEDAKFRHRMDKANPNHPKDHLMFKFWAEYCIKNAGNPFLPKFYGWEAFEWNEEKYLQIRMEKLAKLPRATAIVLQDLYVGGAINRDKNRRKRSLKDIKAFDAHTSPQEAEGVAMIALLHGEKNVELLYKTIAELGDIGRRKGWGIDLHAGNFMMRSDGHIVIVDPWVVM